MIYRINPTAKDKVIGLGSELVYSQRKEWCGATWRHLRMSIIRSRQHFYYDEEETLPVIVFLCGGGFTTVDHNVWIPELSWYAKRGWAVASVEYSVTARTRFPMQLEDIKQAIRYLRAHAEELRIDPERIVVMGESAGGYLSGLVGLTGDRREYDVGEYQEHSSAVKGVVSFYPVTIPTQFSADPDLVPLSPDINCYLDLDKLVAENSPPFMILHGTKDSQVPLRQSEALYEALQEKNVRAELYIFEGAEHADAPFYQTEVKEKILEFIQSI